MIFYYNTWPLLRKCNIQYCMNLIDIQLDIQILHHHRKRRHNLLWSIYYILCHIEDRLLIRYSYLRQPLSKRFLNYSQKQFLHQKFANCLLLIFQMRKRNVYSILIYNYIRCNNLVHSYNTLPVDRLLYIQKIHLYNNRTDRYLLLLWGFHKSYYTTREKNKIKTHTYRKIVCEKITKQTKNK